MEIPQDVHNFMWNNEELKAQTLEELLRPSYLYKPKLIKDGNAWIALLGDNLQEGVASFGSSPDEAYRNFDKVWYEKIKS